MRMLNAECLSFQSWSLIRRETLFPGICSQSCVVEQEY